MTVADATGRPRTSVTWPLRLPAGSGSRARLTATSSRSARVTATDWL